MKTQSEYYDYTLNQNLKDRAKIEAERFVRDETQFQLGHVPTEQPHPYTLSFSSEVQVDPSDGTARLLQVDADLPPVARRIFLTPAFDALVDAMREAVSKNRRICFSGCGSTGRLALMLEEMWRQYWEDRADSAPGDSNRKEKHSNKILAKGDLACSIMTGGDRALIRAVENFEDYTAFGARQVADLDLGAGDIMVAISEGGETSSVIGTAEEALRRDCRVFFLFNNPASILCDTVERSKNIIEDPRVTVLDLFSGSMALTGSTRMQATTLEMLVAGTAMEEAFLVEGGQTFTPANRLERANQFALLISQLGSKKNLEVLGGLAVREAEIYEKGGRITYLASRFLLDIFSDTTERSPTFMLPSFRPGDDENAPISWAYAKDPSLSSEEAWFAMLRHTPRGIDWTSMDYKNMNAPANLISDPPSLGQDEIARYLIGNEQDESRTSADPSWFLQVRVGDVDALINPKQDVLWIGADGSSSTAEGEYCLKIDLPESPILLWHHLAVKLTANTISTASMGLMGRIRGNWMVQLDPTNKKLIDRGSRIISQLTDLSYGDACVELHTSLYAREALRADGGTTNTSPVVDALDRLE